MCGPEYWCDVQGTFCDEEQMLYTTHVWSRYWCNVEGTCYDEVVDTAHVWSWYWCDVEGTFYDEEQMFYTSSTVC